MRITQAYKLSANEKVLLPTQRSSAAFLSFCTCDQQPCFQTKKKTCLHDSIQFLQGQLALLLLTCFSSFLHKIRNFLHSKQSKGSLYDITDDIRLELWLLTKQSPTTFSLITTNKENSNILIVYSFILMVSSRSATLGLEVLVDDIMCLTFFTIILRNYNKMKKDVHYLFFNTSLWAFT